VAIIVRRAWSHEGFCERISAIFKQWVSEDQEVSRKHGKKADPCNVWSCGLGNVGWDIPPTLNRFAKLNENELQTEFRTRAIQLVSESKPPGADREWYFSMSHFGAPSRLPPRERVMTRFN
jgi:hypothetical protein